MKDYTGKTVFLGIDVHKSSYSVAAMCEGAIVKQVNMEACPQKLLAFCHKYFAGASIKSAYEAGFSGFHLHRILVKNGIENIVVHAAGMEVASGDRVKTDKRDSKKIAVQLAAGRLRGNHVPDEDREAKRAITRLRESLMEHRTAVANQIKALLHLRGLIPPKEKARVSAKWLEKVQAKEGFTNLPPEISSVFETLKTFWEFLTTQINETKEKMAIQAIEDEEVERVYRSAPGIGPVGARTLANELGDMSHFENERQVFSITGMTPSEHSSGGYVRKGRISRQGKAIVRKILVLAAWKAIKYDLHLQEVFDRIAAKAGSKRAIVAVARRLIGHIRACFKKLCLYEVKRKTLVASVT